MKKNLALRKINTNQQQKHHENMLSEQNFKIYLRVKPTATTNETNNQNKQILKIISQNKIQIISPYYTPNSYDVSKQYNYEEVFDDYKNNLYVFEKTMLMPIYNVLEGYNSTVFIYGMTGAGKTYTMFGNIGNSTSKGLKNDEEGLVTMTIDTLFRQIQKTPQIKTQVFISFYEIYNENIRDLLQDSTKSHQIMQDPVHGFIINNLTEMGLVDKNHTMETIIAGVERRSMNSTKLNEVSSRSHAILQFTVKRYTRENTMLESKFFMIDLAGNQKTSHNHSNENKRFIEGVNINKSLLTLGKCLNILSQQSYKNQKKNAYVPFRDSKLTRILKESLGGNSKTVMIACVSSQRKFYQQTLNTLKYSSIARKIKNKGIKHNVKIVTKQQLPDIKQFPITAQTPNFHYQSEEKFKKILSDLISAIQEKSKIEKLQQQLEDARQENCDMIDNYSLSGEQSYQIWVSNIQNIDQSLQSLMRKYDKNMEKAESSYQELMNNIFGNIKQRKNQVKSLENQNKEIHRLYEVINAKNQKIRELEEKVSHLSSHDHEVSIAQPQSISCSQNIKIEDTFSQALLKQKNSPHLSHISLASRDSHCSQPKIRKKLTINCYDSSQTPKSMTRQPSREALQVLNMNTSDQRSRSNRILQVPQQKQITITLNKGSAQNHEYKSSQNREQFIQRLKQTEKRAKILDHSVISSLLEEQQANNYQLSNTQLSMLRKLRFFQRQNRALQKSSSLKSNLNKSNSSHNRLTMNYPKNQFKK